MRRHITVMTLQRLNVTLYKLQVLAGLSLVQRITTKTESSETIVYK